MVQTLYERLGVTETATPYEIKKAFRKLATKHHPDRNGGDKKSEDVFKQIANAYETLSDSDLRRQYDAELNSKRNYYTSSQTTQRQQPYQTTSRPQYTTTKNYKRPAQQKGTSGFWVIVVLIGLFYLFSKLNNSNNRYGNASPHTNSNYQNNSYISEETGEINFGSTESKTETTDSNSITNSIQTIPEYNFEETKITKPKAKYKQKDIVVNSPATGEIKF